MRFINRFAQFIVCTAASTGLLQAGRAAEQLSKPNVVFIFADDLGYGEIQALNPERGKIPTPCLNQMAAEGMVFTDAHTGSSVCTPSRYALLTGRYCWRTRQQQRVATGGKPSLIAPGRLTLASLFKDQGYSTAIFGKWHLDYKYQASSRERSKSSKERYLAGVPLGTKILDGPITRGFDKFFGFHHAGSMSSIVAQDEIVEEIDVIDVLPRLTSEVVGYIDHHAAAAKSGKPFFLYFPMSSPHSPIVPTEEWTGRGKLGKYSDFVAQTDGSVGEVLQALDRNGLSDNTIVFFSSDNGTSKVARIDQLEKQGHYPSANLRGSKADLWDGGHRVPFLVRWPGKIKPKTESDQLVCLSDLMATFADYFAVEFGDDAAEDSVSFLQAIFGKPVQEPRTAIVHHSHPGHFSIRENEWKLLLAPGSGGWTAPHGVAAIELGLPEMQLYNMHADISEQSNLVEQYPEKVEELLALLKTYVSTGRSTAGAPQANDAKIDIWKKTWQNKGRKIKATETSVQFPTSLNAPLPYSGDWEDLKQLPVPAWFDDGKIGIFIHWGPYSAIGYRKEGRGYAEHVPKIMYADPKHYYPFVKQRWGAAPPEFGYKDIVADFKAEKWDPDAWAKLFADVGAKYVVLTAEHHDGWANWDSELTPWNAMDKGPRRDLVGELGASVRARGLKYAPSYHRERHTGFFAKDQYKVASPPRPDIAEEIRRDPEAAELYGPFSYDRNFVDDYVARWREIQDKYHPDFMWIDDIPIFTRDGNNPKQGFRPEIQYFYDKCCEMITDYANDAAARGQEVYLNNKGQNLNWPAGVGCREKDNLRLPQVGPKWQSCTTFGSSFGYLAAEDDPSHPARKSIEGVIHEMVEVVSRNGNFLINIGPRADGTIPEWQVERLHAMGDWLRINGEAIYGARYWKTDAQKDEHLAFTTKGVKLYAVKLAKPTGPFVIKATSGWGPGDVKSVRLLGAEGVVPWRVTPQGLAITPPEDLGQSQHAWAFEIVTRTQQHKPSLKNAERTAPTNPRL